MKYVPVITAALLTHALLLAGCDSAGSHTSPEPGAEPEVEAEVELSVVDADALTALRQASAEALARRNNELE